MLLLPNTAASCVYLGKSRLRLSRNTLDSTSSLLCNPLVVGKASLVVAGALRVCCDICFFHQPQKISSRRERFGGNECLRFVMCDEGRRGVDSDSAAASREVVVW